MSGKGMKKEPYFFFELLHIAWVFYNDNIFMGYLYIKVPENQSKSTSSAWNSITYEPLSKAISWFILIILFFYY